MKRLFRHGVLLLVTVVSTSNDLVAQGTLCLSNLDEESAGAELVGGDAWLGSVFRTGSNPAGYELNSIQVRIGSPSGEPSGFAVHLYSMDSMTGLPSAGVEVLAGDDPSAGGLFSYSPDELTLPPSSVYFIVLTAATPTSTGAYPWSVAATTSYTSSENWFPGTGRWYSADGVDWGLSRFTPFQFAVYATPIPEPSPAIVFLVGGAISGLRFLHRVR